MIQIVDNKKDEPKTTLTSNKCDNIVEIPNDASTELPTSTIIGDVVLYAHVQLTNDFKHPSKITSPNDVLNYGKVLFKDELEKMLTNIKFANIDKLEILDGRKARLMKQLEEVERAERKYKSELDILNHMIREDKQ